MSDPTPPPGRLERFDRKDGVFVAVCLIVLAVSAWIAVRHWFDAFPEASIDFKVSREQSETVASAYLRDHGFLPRGTALPGHHAASFVHDDRQRIFLERSFGLQATNALLSGRVRFWRWGHRWFTPLEKEEWRAEVTTAGEVVSCEHLVPEEAAGASLDEEHAKAIAERFFRDTLGRSERDWSYLSARAVKRPHRTDYTFTWKHLGFPELEPLDASYRARVVVAGDAVAGFNEWIEVPEKWQRDYASLRSRNETAGQADALFFLLTAIAILVVFLVQVGKRDVPWRLAVTLGGVGAILEIASSLNALPQALYEFDTTSTYAAFLVRELTSALLSGAGLAAVIFLLTAAGEPLYRNAYGGQVQLGRFFTRRGMRTKSFFRSIVLGITLCGFFLAYQIVFYIVAGKLGAWAPMEVKYDDLLNTRFPWTTVLLIGFMPAITEEFMSRMFSIPFLTRWLKLRWVALFVAAFIWGFGHATYPNQPFWIRGVEVGVAGVIVGVIMLRYGILTTVVWHYTVDALYTALVLLSSASWYNRITSGLAVGWTIIPLGLCLLAYRRRGGFEPETGLTNADAPAPPPPAVTAGAPPPTAAPAGYTPLTVGALAAAVVLIAAATAVAASFRTPIDDLGNLPLSRKQATTAAEARLRELGQIPAEWRHVTYVDSTFDSLDAKYVLSEKRSYDALARLYRSSARPAAYWRVRFFKTEQKEEFTFAVGPTGAILTEHHLLPAEAPGADLSEADARAKAEAYLHVFGVDVAAGGWDPKEAKADKRPKRTDWTFEWEDADHVRRQVVVAGDTPTECSTYLKIPEEFSRNREQVGAVKGILNGIRIVAVLLAVLAGVAVAVIQFRAGKVRWRPVLVGGSVIALCLCATILNTYQTIARGYQTSMPWSLFVVGLAITPLIAAAGSGIFGGLVVAIAASLHPGRVAPLRGNVRDALFGGLAFAAALTLLQSAHGVLEASWVDAALPGSIALPDVLDTTCATCALLVPWITSTLLGAGLLAILASVLDRWARPLWARAGIVVLAGLALLPRDARTSAEWILAALFAFATPLLLWIVAAKLWRGNALAFVLGVGIASARSRCLPLLTQGNARARAAGLAALLVMALVLAVVARRAGSAEARSRSASPA